MQIQCYNHNKFALPLEILENSWIFEIFCEGQKAPWKYNFDTNFWKTPSINFIYLYNYL